MWGINICLKIISPGLCHNILRVPTCMTIPRSTFASRLLCKGSNWHTITVILFYQHKFSMFTVAVLFE